MRNGMEQPGYHDEEPKRLGSNVNVRNFWIRHSQKQSGEVHNAEVTGLSTSSISKGGEERAAAYGETITPRGRSVKKYVSDSSRTNETTDAVITGVKKHHTIEEKNMWVKEELTAYGPSEWLNLYNSKWTANKEKILADQGLKLEDFSSLTPDEQERIAEEAEEPVIQEWLDDPNSELARLHPPRHAAARFASLFHRRHERLAKKLPNDSKIDITHVTHKTVTEPFLASGVLIDKTTRERVTKIAQVGGSLRILDNWESETQTNESGKAETIVRLRGKEYLLDNDLLQQLAKEGVAELSQVKRPTQQKAQKKFRTIPRRDVQEPTNS